MNKLQELKAEIARIEKEEADKKKAEYQYLVGSCVHPAHTSVCLTRGFLPMPATARIIPVGIWFRYVIW